MSDLRRFSSRGQRLDHAYLRDRLRGATAYYRIAGYFRSSIFELVGEEIAGIETVQVVCNSELDARDVLVSQHVRETALKAAWNQVAPEVEALLHATRYRQLHDLLTSGRVEIRVVPKNQVFIHGKAGVIEQADGETTAFMGSVNETKSAFASNYEILWEDPSDEGVKWVKDEFDALWKEAKPLPDAIITEIGRIANRVEVTFEDVDTKDLPAAALAESPIYRGGEQLQPWQRSFVTTFLQHRETYGRARILLADEVGVGKTLSLAASALVTVILDKGPVLILCPSTLCWQWQVEMEDKLGIPSAVWSSSKKRWVHSRAGEIPGDGGPEGILRCPLRIGIVSTGLMMHNAKECEYLLSRKYAMVIVDEAHKARGKIERKARTPNNVLTFLLELAPKAKHLLLGTATPIQTEVDDLWDLMGVLNQGTEFVLGVERHRGWNRLEDVLPLIKGDDGPKTEGDAWEMIRNPLPPAHEQPLFSLLRDALEMTDQQFFSSTGYGSLDDGARMQLAETLDPQFFRKQNPVVRHTVLRRRRALENAGLLQKVGVNLHPDPQAAPGTYGDVTLKGAALDTNYPFQRAYEAAEKFASALGKRMNAAGFMKSLLLQRICSSFAAGRSTAETLLAREVLEDEELNPETEDALKELTVEEASHLSVIVSELSRSDAHDPKVKAVHHFLTQMRSGRTNRTWLDHGCIVFSQYYDTASYLAEQISTLLPGRPIGLYAGVGRSRLFNGGQASARIDRENIKKAVRDRELSLIFATDAACEGLNLQTLGTLINVDLPWNPSRLEQRLGRIKRFGQARANVDMLNLVYHDTQDEKIYAELSRRMKDRYDIFGSLPDTIEDAWIEDIEGLEEEVRHYLHKRSKAQDAFEIRYEGNLDPDAERWEECTRVLARRDIEDVMSRPWARNGRQPK